MADCHEILYAHSYDRGTSIYLGLKVDLANRQVFATDITMIMIKVRSQINFRRRSSRTSAFGALEVRVAAGGECVGGWWCGVCHRVCGVTPGTSRESGLGPVGRSSMASYSHAGCGAASSQRCKVSAMTAG